MSIPKRQHFIPRMHLQHFAGQEPKGHVWTYDAQTEQARHSIPEETAVEAHFYSVKTDDGTMDTRIETKLSEIESKATPVYEMLLKDVIPGETQERMDFAMFLALMYVRTPTMRRMYGEMAGRSMQIVNYAYGTDGRAFDAMLRRYEEESGPLTAEQKERLRQDMIDPTGYVMEVPKERTLPALGVSDALAPILFRMKWCVVEPRHGFFITSDNPLLRDVDPKTRHSFYGDHGFMNKTVQVIMPLSPQRLLLISWSDGGRDNAVYERDQVDRINRALAARSDRYLYAHIHHKWLQQLAAEFKTSRQRMTTEGFGPKKFAQTKVVRRLK